MPARSAVASRITNRSAIRNNGVGQYLFVLRNVSERTMRYEDWICRFWQYGDAMADGWIAAGVAASDMCACAGRYDALVERCEARGMVACHDAAEVVAASDIVVAAVKPYMIEKVFAPLKDALAKKGRSVGCLDLGQCQVGAGPAGASRISRRCPTHRFPVGRRAVIACEKASTLVMSRARGA